MGSLAKKLRRKQYHKAKKIIIRDYQKLTPKEKEEKRNTVNAMLNMIDERIEHGRSGVEARRPRTKPPTPESVMKEIDSLTEDEADEEDRKVDAD